MGRKLWHGEELFFGPCLQLYRNFLNTLSYVRKKKAMSWGKGRRGGQRIGS